LDEDQAARLTRPLRWIAVLNLFAVPAFFFIYTQIPASPETAPLIGIHRLILTAVLAGCIFSLALMRRGYSRAGGAVQILAMWYGLAILPDLLGLPLHVVAANHVALAICMGPLLGWVSSFTLGVASLAYGLILDSPYSPSYGLPPLLPIAPAQVFVIEVALYALMLSLTVLIVFFSQRRSEIGQVTAEALEVASYSEKRLETIIESMADVLLVVDTHGDIAKANRAAFTLLGYTEAELNGKPLRTLLLDIPDEASGVETMAQRTAMRQVNRRLRTKDGRILPVSLSSAVMTDHSGSPTGVILVAQDMTELETIRSELHRSNVRFNQAVAFSRIGVFEYDMDTHEFFIDDAPRQALKIVGMEKVSNFNDFIQFVHPADRPLIDTAVDDHRSGRTPRIDVEFRINTQSGVRWIMVRGALHGGSKSRMIGTFMDVNRRKRAELELARRDAVLRAVTASSEAFLRSANWEAQIPALLSELGAAAAVSRVYAFRHHRGPDGTSLWSQMVEWTADGVQPEIDNPDMQNFDYMAAGFGEWAENLAAREPAYGIVNQLNDGMRAVFEPQQIKSVAIVPVFVQDEWWGLIGFDDCENERVWSGPELDALQLAADSLGAAIYRQRVERDLQTNRDFLMSIVQNLGQGVLVVDGRGRLLFVNPAYAAMTGIPIEGLIGHRTDEFVDPETMDEFYRQRAQRAQGKAGTYTSRILSADGSKTDVLVTAVPRIVDGKPDGAYCVLTDISERRRVEEHRVQLTLEREQMRIMSDFVRDASHDFRTPLSIIQTSLYLLRRKAESPEQLERLNTVGNQASRLSRLIDGLLTMLELDKAEITLIPINLNIVGQNAVDRSREHAHALGLSLDIAVPDEPALVNGEEGYLMKAVANLVDNAIAFTPSGGRIRVVIRAEDERVVLSVSDTGIGIAADEHERIFERLYKVDKARTIDSGGLGMGLSITKRIMELHGGGVAVTSSPGEGSTFTLTFARARQAAPRSRGPATVSSPIAQDVKM
jgi:PAS domain S-box-containing protein